MKSNSNFISSVAAILFLLTFVAAGEAFAQKANVVAIDPERNAVRVVNSTADPVAVKVVENGPARKQHQVRVRAVINPGEVRASHSIALPAGKRFVIENINAYNNRNESLQIVMQIMASMDANGDGNVSVDELGIFYIPMTDQIGFSSGATDSYGNHKVLIFADERIGTGTQLITLNIALNGIATKITQGVVTLTGYLEDLPSNQ